MCINYSIFKLVTFKKTLTLDLPNFGMLYLVGSANNVTHYHKLKKGKQNFMI